MNVQQNYAHILPQAGFSKYREVVEGIPPVEGMGNFAGRMGNFLWSQIATLD